MPGTKNISNLNVYIEGEGRNHFVRRGLYLFIIFSLKNFDPLFVLRIVFYVFFSFYQCHIYFKEIVLDNSTGIYSVFTKRELAQYTQLHLIPAFIHEKTTSFTLKYSTQQTRDMDQRNFVGRLLSPSVELQGKVMI